MKKVFVLILLFFVMTELHAQEQWSFGPRIGMGFSKNYYSHYYSNNIIGLFGEFRVNKIATELDVLFTKQGTFNATYQCTVIPLKFKYYPRLNDGFNIFAGPQLTMYKEEPARIIMSGGPYDYHYNKTTAAIIVGLGYRTKIGLDIAFNYNHGLVDINKEKHWGKKWRERVFQITAGYDLCQLFKAGKNK